MHIRYIGPLSDGVELAATGDVVYPGEVIEVADELGIVCCEQVTNWEPAGPADRRLFDEFLTWVAAHERDPRTGGWRERRVEPAGQDDGTRSPSTDDGSPGVVPTPAPDDDTSPEATDDSKPAKAGRARKAAAR